MDRIGTIYKTLIQLLPRGVSNEYNGSLIVLYKKLFVAIHFCVRFYVLMGEVHVGYRQVVENDQVGNVNTNYLAPTSSC